MDAAHPEPFPLQGFIEDHREHLAPPVCNELVYGKGCGFKIMIVGGPNERTDYHVNKGEEWFYQMKGNMILKVVDGGVFKDLHIREGEVFLLPPNVPHSPQRPEEGSIGLVVERERLPEEMDFVRWYCSKCRGIVHQVEFHCDDLVNDMPPVIHAYYGSTELRTCKQCNHVDQPHSKANPAPSLAGHTVADHDTGSHPTIDTSSHPMPFNFASWIEDNKQHFKPPVCNKLMLGKSAEFKVMLVGGPNIRSDYHVEDGEEWFYQLKGNMHLPIVDGDTFRTVHIREGHSFLLPPNVPHSPQRPEEGSIGLVIERFRYSHEMDKLRWYCKNTECRELLYEEVFHCDDLDVQLPPVFDRYYSQERKCTKCGRVDEPKTVSPSPSA